MSLPELPMITRYPRSTVTACRYPHDISNTALHDEERGLEEEIHGEVELADIEHRAPLSALKTLNSGDCTG